MDVEWLGLVDEGGSANCQIYDLPLADLPNCLVQILDVLWYAVDILDGSVGG